LTTQDLNAVQFSNSLPASSGNIASGEQIVGQYRGMYEKYQRYTTYTTAQSNFQEKFTVTISGFDQATQNSLFQTVVFPGSISKIIYTPDGTSFRAQDQFNNDLDCTQDPDFFIQVISQQRIFRQSST
jgi:hypothetical protein